MPTATTSTTSRSPRPTPRDALRFLTGELGGTVIFGGQCDRLPPDAGLLGDADGDGMTVELLEPWAVEHNDFLARFVARHGAGPHHLTFKVPDLAAAIERVRSAGFQPVNIDVSDPEWKEAFLMPREAHGTVVQLAETHGDSGTRAELLAHVARARPEHAPALVGRPGAGARAAGDAAARRAAHTQPVVGARLLRRRAAGRRRPPRPTTAPTRVAGAARGSASRTQPDATPGVDRLEVDGLDAPSRT